MSIGKRLEKDYPCECAKLIELCGFDALSDLPQYLNDIYTITEKKWEENVQRLIKYDVHIKYVMFGEAAPRTLEGEVNYFYNNCSGSWCQAIIESFIPCAEIPGSVEGKLDALAQKQFLLVDTIPFSVNYSKPNNYRNKAAYKELINLCAHSYLHNKLFDPRLKWDKDVKVAFGVKKNASAMMENFPNGFTLPNGQKIFFSLDLVPAEGENHSYAERIRKLFDLT